MYNRNRYRSTRSSAGVNPQYNRSEFALLDHVIRDVQEKGNTGAAASVNRSYLAGSLTLLVLLIAPLAVWIAWSIGRSDASIDVESSRFQVSGESMAPTLMGEHRLASCPRCALLWRVHPGVTGDDSSALQCAHCGDLMDLIDPRVKGRNASTVAADMLEITDLDPNFPLARGELVAVSWEGQLHVKRIAAVAGDTVDLERLKLLVNGIRVEDLLVSHSSDFPLPKFLVDDDARRRESRWAAAQESPLWERTPAAKWRYHAKGDSPWLVYHHQSIHSANRSSPVRDDYPFNVGLVRQLESVDRLFLGGSAAVHDDRILEVAFFSEHGNVIATANLPKTETGESRPFQLSYHDGIEAPELPVAANSPVAVRVRGGGAELSQLSIERLVEYRIRRRDSRTDYPLRVGSGEYFLLGDNVPVSVDSRQLGTFSSSQIAGRVIGVERSKSMRDSL